MKKITKVALACALLVAACDVPPEQEQQTSPTPAPAPAPIIDATQPWAHHGVIGLDDSVDVAALVKDRIALRARLTTMDPKQREVEAIQQGLHCTLDLPPFGCQAWTPDPLPGFVLVAGNYSPASNEYVMCEAAGTYCQKCAMLSGGFYNIGNLVDWGSSSQFYTKAIRSQMHGNQGVYQNTNWGGSSWGWFGAITLSNVPGTTGYKINSVTIAN